MDSRLSVEQIKLTLSPDEAANAKSAMRKAHNRVHFAIYGHVGRVYASMSHLTVDDALDMLQNHHGMPRVGRSDLSFSPQHTDEQIFMGTVSNLSAIIIRDRLLQTNEMVPPLISGITTVIPGAGEDVETFGVYGHHGRLNSQVHTDETGITWEFDDRDLANDTYMIRRLSRTTNLT